MANIVFLEVVQTFGGARKSTIELATRLAKNHSVEIVDLYGSCGPFVEACQKAGQPLTILQKRDNPFLLSSSNVLKRICNYIYFIFHILQINKSLRMYLAKYDKCWVMVNNSKALSFLFRKPRNITIALFARGWFVRQQISKIDRVLYGRLVDKYIAVSEATRQAIYGAGLASLQNIYVVHNAIDVPTVMPHIEHPSNRAVKILFAGGFLPTKGQRVAIGVAKSLVKEGLPFEMILAGIIYKGDVSQRYHDEIKKEIIDLQLQDKVRLVVNNNDIRNLFDWCDIFCHPSDTEGLPRVVMEAMSMAKPVLANAVGGVTDYILNDYTGIITHHNDVDDYVAGIKRLCEDADLYYKITQRAFELVSETYSEEAQLNQFGRLLKNN